MSKLIHTRGTPRRERSVCTTEYICGRDKKGAEKKLIVNIILKIGRAVCHEINIKKMKKTSYKKAR